MVYHTNFHHLERDLIEREVEASALRYLLGGGLLAHAGPKLKEMVNDSKLLSIFQSVRPPSSDALPAVEPASVAKVIFVCLILAHLYNSG